MFGGKIMGIAAGSAIAGAMVMALATGAVGSGVTGVSTPSSVNVNDKAAIEKIVRAYILANPEILTEAYQILQNRELAKVVNDNRAVIETPFAGAWEGNPKGDVTVVEFFDYACGFCRTARPDIEQLLASDPNVKVVYHEMPVLGEGSLEAAKISLAAAKQGKYLAFHKAMYAAGRPDATTITKAIKAAGLDEAAARSFAKAPEAEKILAQSQSMQRGLQLSGTPSWVIGDQVFGGKIGLDGLKEAVAKARERKKT
jgi:protein-disulfide isomerase